MQEFTTVEPVFKRWKRFYKVLYLRQSDSTAMKRVPQDFLCLKLTNTTIRESILLHAQTNQGDTMPTLYCAHGKESGPWGAKIKALADVAKGLGYRVESPDYSDLQDPDKRIERLLQLCGTGSADLLVGSSMGGYVATVASTVIRPKALFLMAPAFCLPGYAVQEPAPCADRTVIVHGWHDAVVPPDNSIRFARQHQAQLHLLDSDHRLNDQIPLLVCLFSRLLVELG